MGWGGWTYPIALAQALVAFVPLTRLPLRPGLMLLVPVLSAALTAGLLGLGMAQGHATA